MSPRILEIGHLNFIEEAWPEHTERIDTTFFQRPGENPLARLKALAVQFLHLCRVTFRRRYDLVFCRCFGRFVYRRNLSLPVNALRLVMTWLVQGCVAVLAARGMKLAVIDQLDEMTIGTRDLFLLRRCCCYFKRELPQNTWNTFLRVQPPHGEFIDLTSNPAFTPYLDRFAPLSLGIDPAKVREIDETVRRMPGAAKDIDIFYAGAINHSTVRTAGMEQLEALRRRGYRVEICVGYLPYEEFVATMRRSWLVWSPEGQGWDCYRHYEASVAGSVALVNQAGIRRYQPLLAGVHCVQYAVEGDDLCWQVERALADRPALERMSAAAREHVLEYHGYRSLGDYMVRHAWRVAMPDAQPLDARAA